MNNHITEAVWFDARKYLPNTARPVCVVFKKFNKSNTPEKRMSEAKFEVSKFAWTVDSISFNPSLDIVTQWAEIDVNRGGFMPDDFPLSREKYTFIENKQ